MTYHSMSFVETASSISSGSGRSSLPQAETCMTDIEPLLLATKLLLTSICKLGKAETTVYHMAAQCALYV